VRFRDDNSSTAAALLSQAPGGPTHMINANYTLPGSRRHDVFYVGNYDPTKEKFLINMTLGPQIIESGLSGMGFPAGEASWAVRLICVCLNLDRYL
jgi:hypothetical protein